MNGPEHYREAERLLVVAGDFEVLSETQKIEHVANIAEAQVHATLALAAATALGQSEDMRGADAEAWERVCSVLPVEFPPPLVDDAIVCGVELNPGAGDGVTCIRYTDGDQHSDGFHDDGRGNRWTTHEPEDVVEERLCPECEHERRDGECTCGCYR